MVPGGTIVFPLGHIRPRQHADSEDIVVIVTAPAPSKIPGTWSATCSNHDTVITGSLEITVGEPSISLPISWHRTPVTGAIVALPLLRSARHSYRYFSESASACSMSAIVSSGIRI